MVQDQTTILELKAMLSEMRELLHKQVSLFAACNTCMNGEIQLFFKKRKTCIKQGFRGKNTRTLPFLM